MSRINGEVSVPESVVRVSIAGFQALNGIAPDASVITPPQNIDPAPLTQVLSNVPSQESNEREESSVVAHMPRLAENDGALAKFMIQQGIWKEVVITAELYEGKWPDFEQMKQGDIAFIPTYGQLEKPDTSLVESIRQAVERGVDIVFIGEFPGKDPVAPESEWLNQFYEELLGPDTIQQDFENALVTSEDIIDRPDAPYGAAIRVYPTPTYEREGLKPLEVVAGTFYKPGKKWLGEPVYVTSEGLSIVLRTLLGPGNGGTITLVGDSSLFTISEYDSPELKAAKEEAWKRLFKGGSGIPNEIYRHIVSFPMLSSGDNEDNPNIIYGVGREELHHGK